MHDFISVTEMAGDHVSTEQVDRLYQRYGWAMPYCRDRDVLEVACGTGAGLGFLKSHARSLIGADLCDNVLSTPRLHYGDRIDIRTFDAQDIPLPASSLDVVILFEALYYLPEPLRFFQSCQRVLRPGGHLLIATANKDLSDFNPSPLSTTYFGSVELAQTLNQHGFEVSLYGNTPYENTGLRQRTLRPLKQAAVSLGLLPKSKAGKMLLKRFVFGKPTHFPWEIKQSSIQHAAPEPISNTEPDQSFKVIFCEATLKHATQ
ncbi:MAG: methyltransferase domain-containing protein [Magnetococcales bacterium]|nr:methyltransferase domain-containing protein [Magnetococcales bacterium]